MSQHGLVEGGIRFNISCKITAEEMKDWKPEQIAKFFDGIALMEAATNVAAIRITER